MVIPLNRKISKTWESTGSNKIDINRLKVIKKTNQNVTILKRERKIRLAEGVLLVDGSFQEPFSLEYTFENLSDWVIPFIKVYTVFNTTEGYTIDDSLSFTQYTQWKQVPGGIKLNHILWGSLKDPITNADAPLYYTTDIVILNKNVWHQIKSKKR